MEALLCVPVELKRAGEPEGPRWFRLALVLSIESVRLRSALPEELREGPISLRLHLPLETDPPPPPLDLVGVAGEVVVDEGQESERAEARLVLLKGLSPAARALIERYVAQRLAPDLVDSAAPDG